MDATIRPLQIPPKYATYAEEHGIFDMMKRMLQQLILHRPEDPLTFLINMVDSDNDDLPQAVILGPPVSGKKSIGNMISAKLRSVHLNLDVLLVKSKEDSTELTDAKNEANNFINMGKARTMMFDCMRKGWVLTGFPQTRLQAIALQAAGVLPKHVVVLDLPEAVALERAAGKKIDLETGDIYHTTFDWPSDPEILGHLTEPTNYSDEQLKERAEDYRRHIGSLLQTFGAFTKIINSDSPKGDVFLQVMSFLATVPRSPAPRTPRIILLGPSGCGKSFQAARLAAKYDLVNVHCGQLIKEHIAAQTKMGMAVKPYRERKMMVADVLVLNILTERLGQIDAVSKGWVLHGYPISLEQAEQLTTSGYAPTRVFVMDIPIDSCVERICLRRVDPVTGDRYHLMFNPPVEQAARDRLETHPNDSEELVRKSYARWQTFSEELMEFYKHAQHVNADQDPHTVFEVMESLLVNPLPKTDQ